MMGLSRLAVVAIVATGSLAGLPAAAASFSGAFWDVPANTIATIDQAISAVNGGSDPTTATFQSTSIAYGDGPGWPIGSLSAFLNADAGSIVGTDVASIQESVFRLTGKTALTNGQQVTVTSDDGFRLFLDGSLFSEFTGLRGPNSTTSAVWGGATGIYDMTLWYFEGNVSQAQLLSNLAPVAAPIPLPGAAMLLMPALAALGIVGRRRKRTV